MKPRPDSVKASVVFRWGSFRRPAERVRGFTLLELLLVVCILGVLLAVSLPRFSGTHRNLQLQELAKTLCAQLRFCQEYSAANDVEVRMSYLPAQRRFAVQAATDGGATRFREIPMPWDSILEVPVPVEVERFAATYADGGSETDRVLFRPYGPVPTVDLSLQCGPSRAAARYAGATRLTVMGQ